MLEQEWTKLSSSSPLSLENSSDLDNLFCKISNAFLKCDGSNNVQQDNEIKIMGPSLILIEDFSTLFQLQVESDKNDNINERACMNFVFKLKKYVNAYLCQLYSVCN